MTLLNKDGNLYTFSREEPTIVFKSLGLHIDLSNTLSNALDDVIHVYQEFSTQMNNEKCNKPPV